MSERPLTDAQLQALLAVADCRGFTAAARQLGTSQSAVSHAVAGLEQALDSILVSRTASGLRLTEAGETVVAHARAVLQLKNRIRTDTEALRKRRQGTLKIGSFGVSASRRLLPPLMNAFTSRYPEIKLVIHEGSDPEVEQWIRDGEVDLGFVTLPNDEFDTVGLWQDEMQVLLSDRHPLATQPHVRAQDLHAWPFIMSTGGCEVAIRASVQAAPLDVRHRIRDNDTIIAMVGRQDGITVLPALALPDPLPDGVAVRPLETPCFRQVALAVKQREGVSPACEAFLNLSGVRQATGCI